mmetsp:Transcript_3710/g.5398  ORF Transcript_3710/g.5398 Transcript_3710/m.5398 type:complete len:84 (-) Transcript_3710:1759-2010(-)
MKQNNSQIAPRPEGGTFMTRLWDNLYAEAKCTEQAPLIKDVEQLLEQASYRQTLLHVKKLLAAPQAINMVVREKVVEAPEEER